LEGFSNHVVETITSKQTDDDTLLVIEVGNQRKDFALTSAQVKKDPEIFSKCAYCNKQELLQYHCRCLQVSYCNRACQMNDG